MSVERVLEEKPRPAVQVARLYPSLGEWTERDYFSLPDTNHIVELSDGELIMPPHPTDTHQRVVLRLVLALNAFVETHNLGVIRFAPLPVRLWPGKIREPDILFLSRVHADRRGELVWGPPDLAVEVLSPGTEETDRREKPAEYAHAGVSEYWIVDPRGQTVEVLVLEGKVYAPLGRFGVGEIVRSRVLEELRLAINDIFAE